MFRWKIHQNHHGPGNDKIAISDEKLQFSFLHNYRLDFRPVPIGWFQLVSNPLIAKQFFSLLQNLHCPNFPKVLFIRIDIPNFPKSVILIDWYRNSNIISVTAGLVSSLKILIECYSLVQEDCFEKSFFLIRASSHPDPDCPKNLRNFFYFWLISILILIIFLNYMFELRTQSNCEGLNRMLSTLVKQSDWKTVDFDPCIWLVIVL